MLHEFLIPLFNFIGMIGFLLATGIGAVNFLRSDIEQPFWLAFVITASLGALWLGVVTIEWLGISSDVMDQFSSSLRGVIIGLYAFGVIGTFVFVGELSQSQREVDKRASLVSVLSRVLRHNIRNDITVIRGYVMADGGNNVVEEKIENLIKTSEKARKLEESIESDQRFQHVAVDALVREVIHDVTSSNPAVSIELEPVGDDTVTVAPSVQTALNELVENAIVHGGEDVAVTVDVVATDDLVRISVSDNGSGLPEYEQQVLEIAEETPLSHGSGIGLWMARWIVETQGGDVAAHVDESGTTVSVTLPRESARF